MGKKGDSVNKGEDLKVLIVASEVAPYAKSGGLGDVAGSLPKALKALGVDVRVAMPKYKSIKERYLQDVEFVESFSVSLSWRTQKATILKKQTEFPIYMIENDYYFERDGFYGYGDDNERFAFFSKAVVDMLPMLDFYPDVIHCNDWQTGPVCLYLRETYKKMLIYQKIKTLFTIHNLQYQGNFSKNTMELLEVPIDCYNNGNIEFFGNVSFMKAGLMYADRISTVSKRYAEEIQTSGFGYGMDGILQLKKGQLSGIINGIDYSVNDPASDPRIYHNFDIDHIDGKYENKRALQEELGLPRRDVPIISIVSRLADQKGLDIISVMMDELLQKDIQFIVLGTGEGRYEMMFRGYEESCPNKMRALIQFDDTLAQKIYAGSDMFMMPSLFEPCGLGQMFSLRYGTIPIVRKTGGLADTITHYNPETKEGNGFVFEDYNGEGLMWAVNEALKAYYSGEENWRGIVKNAMSCNYSWGNSAQEYKNLYLDMVSEDK